MTNRELIMLAFSVGFIPLFLIGPYWVSKTRLSWGWFRAISWFVSGMIIASIFAGFFINSKKSDIYVAIGVGYFLGFIISCTEIPRYLFHLLPDKVQTGIKIVIVVIEIAIILVIVFTQKFELILAIIIFLWILVILSD